MSIPTPGVIDPFAGTPSPDEMMMRPDGSIIVPHTDPYHGVVAELLTPAGADKLTRAYDALANLQSAQEQLQAAKAVLPALEQQAALVPTLQAQVNALTAQVEASNNALAAAMANGGTIKRSEQATEDDGTPIEGAILYTPDPFYKQVAWTAQAEFSLNDGDGVLGLIGTAGGGKTKFVQEWCARNKIPLMEFSAKGSDPHEWIELREVTNENGVSITKWVAGPILRAIQVAAKTGRKICIFIDELDTTAISFQMTIAKALEAEGKQRRLATQGFGMVECPPNVIWVAAMNANGTNPSSRHRGMITAALQNRIEWTRVPMFTAPEMEAILRLQFPAVKELPDIAECLIRLMVASERGKIDADISVRTGIKLLRRWKLGAQKAWNLALLDGFDDPAMRAEACAILSDRFTLA